MKKLAKLMCLILTLVMCIGLCAGCSSDSKDEGKTDGGTDGQTATEQPKATEAPAATAEPEKAVYTLTIMNGETQIGTIQVKEGELVDQAEIAKLENLEDYTFHGWYTTPGFLAKTAVDMTKDTFDKDRTIFGDFITTVFTEDTRPAYIVGDSKKGGFLAGSKWAGELTDAEKLTYQLNRTAENKNEFAITLDMYDGDEFQVILNWKWDDQHGFGYVADVDANAEFMKTSRGGGLSNDAKKGNISIIKDGNYTVILTTDLENSDRDTIKIVRNGDATVTLAEATPTPEPTAAPTSLTGEDINVRVKGSWVADWSDIKVLENIEGTSDWTITMELAKDTELCFAGYNADKDSGIIMKEQNVADDASKALLVETGNNIKVAADGSYTFTVSAADLSVKIELAK